MEEETELRALCPAPPTRSLWVPCSRLAVRRHYKRAQERGHSRDMSAPCVRQSAMWSAGSEQKQQSSRLKAVEAQVATAQAAAQAAEQAAAKAEQRAAKLETVVGELRKQLEQALKAGAMTPVEATPAFSAPRGSYPAALAPGPVPRAAPDSGFDSQARSVEPAASSRRNAAAMAEEAAMRLIQTLNAPQSPGLSAPLPLNGADPTPAAQRAAEALARARERIHRNAEGGTPIEGATRGSALLSSASKHEPY